MNILKFKGTSTTPPIKGQTVSDIIYTVPVGKIAKVIMVNTGIEGNCLYTSSSHNSSTTVTYHSTASLLFGGYKATTVTTAKDAYTILAENEYGLISFYTPTHKDNLIFLEGETIEWSIETGSANNSDNAYVNYDFMVIEEDI